MSNSKTLWCVLLVVWIAGSSYWHVCKIKQLCDVEQGNQTQSVTIGSIDPLIISDSSSLKIVSQGNFTFAKNGSIPNMTLVQSELDSLVSYLNANPHKRLIVTGQYLPAEEKPATFSDLGMARAYAMKEWLVGKGISDSLVIIHSVANEALKNMGDSLAGGLIFGFKSATAPLDKIAYTETELANEQKFDNIFKPMDLYFPTASSDYIKTDQNQRFITAAQEYLAKNKDHKLILTGHTDNEDSAEWNLTLSKKRANAVRNQFILMGIAPGRIVARGKGEWEPKASNDTPQGKRANRRVAIVVK
jgi:OOP family OmpA-OmpF porin